MHNQDDVLATTSTATGLVSTMRRIIFASSVLVLFFKSTHAFHHMVPQMRLVHSRVTPQISWKQSPIHESGNVLQVPQAPSNSAKAVGVEGNDVRRPFHQWVRTFAVVQAMALLLLACMLAVPSAATAVGSGGRISGSNRQSSQSRSYSGGGGAKRSSGAGYSSSRYYSSRSGPMVIPGGPLYYTPYPGGVVGYGYGYGSGFLPLALLWGGVALAQVLRAPKIGRFGGTSMDSGAAIDPGMSTVQLGFVCPRGSGSSTLTIIDRLNELAQMANTSSAAGLSALLREVCTVALRYSQDWKSCGCRAGRFSSVAEGAEAFDQFLVSERIKWDKDITPATSSPDRPTTYVVLTIHILWSNFGSLNSYLQKPLRTPSQLSDFLRQLSGRAAAGQGSDIRSIEILWTPSDANDVLYEDELREKWPELIDL
jgi:uncharacterized membrane protein